MLSLNGMLRARKIHSTTELTVYTDHKTEK